MIERISYSPDEAAIALGMTIDRVYELCRDAMTRPLDDPSRFPARRDGSRWRISVRGLQAWIDEGPAVLAGNSTRNRKRVAS